MRTHPIACIALILVAGCSSPDANDATSATDVASVQLPEASAAGVVMDAGTSIYGDLSHADARTVLATYSESARNEVEQDMTRTVSMEAVQKNSGRRVVTAVRLRDGRLLTGHVVSDDGRAVEFAFETEEGTKGTTKIAYDALHPESVADLMLARADERDAGALIDVAEYAAAERMYDVARVSYLAAAEADPSVESIAESRLKSLAEQLAAEELARGNDAASAGDDLRARRILRRIQREFAGMPAADDAAEAVAQIDARIAQRKVDATRARQLAPIQRLYDESVDLTGKGIRQSDRPTNAIRTFLLARSKTTSARRKLQSATRSADKSGDDALLGALDDLNARFDMQERDNEIQLGTSYLDKGDYAKARAAARAALALDPEDKEALSLVTQVNEAEEESRYDNYDDYYNGYWRYGRGRGWYRWHRPRPTPYPRGWYPRRGRSWGGIHRGGVRGGGAFRGGTPPIGRGGVRVGGAIGR